MGSYLIEMAGLLLQGCAGTEGSIRDRICGNWESVDGKPDILIYREGEAYKVTVFKRSGLSRRMKPETYLLQEEENGNIVHKHGLPHRCGLQRSRRCADILPERGLCAQKRRKYRKWRGRVMRDNDISQQVKTRTITVLYGFLTQRQEIPEYILKEYGLTEDYAMYNRIENMEYEDYETGRKDGRLPDITALEARLTRKIEAAMESCGKPPVPYLEKLNEELDALGIIARNPEYADRIFYKLDFFAKYGIDRTAPHRTQAGQAEKAYR